MILRNIGSTSGGNRKIDMQLFYPPTKSSRWWTFHPSHCGSNSYTPTWENEAVTSGETLVPETLNQINFTWSTLEFGVWLIADGGQKSMAKQELNSMVKQDQNSWFPCAELLPQKWTAKDSDPAGRWLPAKMDYFQLATRGIQYLWHSNSAKANNTGDSAPETLKLGTPASSSRTRTHHN